MSRRLAAVDHGLVGRLVGEHPEEALGLPLVGILRAEEARHADPEETGLQSIAVGDRDVDAAALRAGVLAFRRA
jgi:hypothetical protein